MRLQTLAAKEHSFAASVRLKGRDLCSVGFHLRNTDSPVFNRPFSMNSRRWLALLAVSTVALIAFARTRVQTAREPQPVYPVNRPAGSDATDLRAPYDPQLVHKTLEFWAKSSQRDNLDAISRAQLAHWYLESYRETGDSADITRAEQAARASLAIRPTDAALMQLARALLNQHRFAAALKEAKRAALVNPDGFRLAADIEYEMGDYATAQKDLLKAPPQQESDPSFYALLSRFSELRGDSKTQLDLLKRATQQADANIDDAVQSVSWFHERRGRALFMTGHLDEAEKSYRKALQVFPRDYRTMVAMARLEAARQNWKAAIEWGQKAAAIVPAPDTLALLGDAYQAQGEPNKAAAQFALVEKIGVLSRAQGNLYDRQRAIYYADHNMKAAQAVQLARGELKVRHDIYAYDTLAWTLFKAGKLDEAAQNMTKALKWNTRDASLWFHAGMIAAARGQKAEARRDLELALAINPQFHHSQPQLARATLAKLDAGK